MAEHGNEPRKSATQLQICSGDREHTGAKTCRERRLNFQLIAFPKKPKSLKLHFKYRRELHMQWSDEFAFGRCGAEGSEGPAVAISTYELERGMSNDELCLHYQPKVALHTGRIVGAEALVRWHSPKFGFLLPGRFISTAEQSGQIVELGRRVLQTACAQARSWQISGVPVPGISVNASPAELAERDYAIQVRRALSRANLRPNMLTLEITESMAIDGPQQMEHLYELAECGVRISLDDFGTGHASLRHLRQLPVHELKIDRSFVSGITHSTQDAAIVGALIAIAKSSGIVTVAEGVVALEQQAVLADLGCDQIQGSLISMAAPPCELEHLAHGFAHRAGKLDALLSPNSPVRVAGSVSGPLVRSNA